MSGDALTPLLGAMKQLDAAIQAQLDKLASLRKRREAIHTAIEIVRSGEFDVEETPASSQMAKVEPPAVVTPVTISRTPSSHRVSGDELEVLEKVILRILKERGRMGVRHCANWPARSWGLRSRLIHSAGYAMCLPGLGEVEREMRLSTS